MADSSGTGWPVAESSVIGDVNGRGYLPAKKAADLYGMVYSTFVKRLKNFVQFGEYPEAAFRVERLLGSQKREHWRISIHPVLGIRALNEHFYPRLFE